MKAVTTLEVGVRRSFREAAACAEKQREEFLKMRNEITSQPYTQAVLNRLEFSQENEATDDIELLALQASSFSEFLSNVDLGKIICLLQNLGAELLHGFFYW